MDKRNFTNWLWEKRYLLSFTAIAVVYFFNMLIDIMELDAAQYAAMSREMMFSSNILEVYERGRDFLDKPPLLFWLASFTMKLFGVFSFTYKLPAVLVIVLGIYSTYRFTLLFYNRNTALLSALILSTTQAMFLVTNDVRTDGMLTGFIIFAVWQLSEYIRNQRFVTLLLAAIGAAGALMTKGPIGLVIIAMAFGGGLLLKGDWKNIFKPQWLILLLIVAVLIAPMCYGLYTQFDLHPEKTVYGLKGPSGLKFFFWTQSFGRITGDIYWDNNPGFFFFFHSILWDFQPWVLFFIPALFISIYSLLFSTKLRSQTTEWMSLTGFVLPFMALSFSHFKLPHYIFPLFPFAAVLTANFIHNQLDTSRLFGKWLIAVQSSLLFIFFGILAVSFVFFFAPGSVLFPLLLVLGFSAFITVLIRLKAQPEKVVFAGTIAVITFNLLLSVYFYPTLLSYQANSMAGKEIARMNIPEGRVYVLGVYIPSLDFYANRTVPKADDTKLETYEPGTYIYTDQAGMENLIQTRKLNYSIYKSFDDFPVTGLSITFLNKETRQTKLGKRYLLLRN